MLEVVDVDCLVVLVVDFNWYVELVKLVVFIVWWECGEVVWVVVDMDWLWMCIIVFVILLVIVVVGLVVLGVVGLIVVNCWLVNEVVVWIGELVVIDVLCWLFFVKVSYEMWILVMVMCGEVEVVLVDLVSDFVVLCEVLIYVVVNVEFLEYCIVDLFGLVSVDDG